MYKTTRFVLKAFRKILRSEEINHTDEFIQYKDQEANDLIRNLIESNQSGLMISKFGSTELSNILCFMLNDRGLSLIDYYNHIRSYISIDKTESINSLFLNSGFFPNDERLGFRFTQRVLDDIKNIDVLASYLKNEIYLQTELSHCIKVNLDSYYAPFLWKNPWTKKLKGKKVLVIHPFTESIKEQYEKRTLLFEDPDVLPEFKELILLQAVQSLAGEPTSFNNWFEALEYMESYISKLDFDVALIGCGAYGMCLAAYIKKMGKIAVHLAGWTQMLFGIYGNRWIVDQPKYAKFINPYWIRPSKNETPKNAAKIERGCYW